MISAEKNPNNVGLSSNKRLQRALEHWQPAYIQWWKDMGPQGFQDYHQVYVRTAVSVDPSGWAHFEYVKLPEYRWGIFLADPFPDRRIGFGDFFGEPVWQEVPGEFRNQLRRLIVTQGDTEPASVEQQRWLGQRCPSMYDLINLWFSLSLDLHGNEISTNAASYFSNGLKGRAQEEKWNDHQVKKSMYELDV